jgi:hypothetical protein
VDWDDLHQQWDVLADDGRHIGHCSNQNQAIDLAICEAIHDHGLGKKMIVCVQEKDGSYRVAWASSHGQL